ncbi:MAG: carbohydrate kinase family protein [Candidatus Colwellbacteria bacterium]|nr:carbohydrate kinase family protein [Candidatus Colwellbacteria bacterium]
MRDITTIGSATFDIFMEGDFNMVTNRATPLGKGIMIPLGEKMSIDDVFSTAGGNAMNAAVTFRRQGLRTAARIKIGDDVPGLSVIHRLKDEGIESSLVSVDRKLSTSTSVLLSNKGERTIMNYRGAGGELSISDIDIRKLKSRWWYISLPGKAVSMLPAFLRYARQEGIRVALNPSGWHIAHSKKTLLRHLKDVDFLVLNAGEAAELVGIPFSEEKKVFKALDALVPGIVAVTDGSRGVIVSDGSYIYKAGIFKEKKLIDRTGAGDAFGSGFVAGLIRKNEECEKGRINPENIIYAIRLGTANAASVVERFGGSEGALTKKEFDTNKRWSRLKVVKIEI